jgi:hypothetical protein
MRFQIVLPAVLFGSAVVASQLNERFVDPHYNFLSRRQQFVPTTTTAQGQTCSDAFGAGYVTCKSHALVALVWLA